MRHLFWVFVLIGVRAVADVIMPTNMVVISTVESDSFIVQCFAPVSEECTNGYAQVHEMSGTDGVSFRLETEPDEAVFPSLPGPESVTNAIAEALLDASVLSSVDNFQYEEGDVMLDQVTPIWTWDGFLGEDETNGVTRTAKKACFDWYLSYLATNTTPLAGRQSRLAQTAIHQCLELSYTNSWRRLMQIARNPMSVAREAAGELAVNFAPKGVDLISFGLDFYTNGVFSSQRVRGNVIHAFAVRLTDWEGNASTNAAMVLFLHPAMDNEAAMALDQLFVNKIPGYALSSNRLERAMSVLHDSESWEYQNNYFRSVTNQLESILHNH